MSMHGSKHIRDRRRFRLLAPLLLFILLALALPAGAADPEPIDLSQAVAPLTAPLSLDERVSCQTAIEMVYWRHRIWPEQNPGAKPPLEAIMPVSAIQAKVADSLRQSNALAALWQQPISGQQLQAEMERMAAQSRQPELLRQLWTALGNDPYLVAECLARPLLAQRLLDNWYGQDERFDGAGQPFAQWWQSSRASYALELDEPAYAYSLPEIAVTGIAFDDDAWLPTPALPERTNGTAVWTGTEMIIWGGGSLGTGRSAGGARYNPATDSWLTTSLIDAPIGRFEHTAVWTGTEMIVWGGCGPFDFSFCELGDGARYNPAADQWTPVSNSNDPSARMRHTAVWTGSEMIIWGGCNPLSSGASCAEKDTGGRYDPSTDSWTPTSTVNTPPARYYHTAVWTGSEMIVWGGYDGLTLFNSGGRYDPATDSWTATTLTNAPTARKDHTAVWTGSEMIVWGGCETPACPIQGSPTNTGGRYNPATNSWTPTSTAGAPSARANHSAVWTGTEMIVWGGESAPGSLFNTGGRYNPATNSWTPTSNAGAPAPRAGHQAVWTGSLMIVWGGGSGVFDSRSGGRYDPATDSWTPTNDSDPDSFRAYHTAIWTGAEMIAWGGEDTPFGDAFGSGVIYDPATRTWRDTPLNGAPSGRIFHTAVWTGQEMIVWGGQSGTTLFRTGGRYNPATNTWVATNTTGAPSSRANHTAIWTGTEMIIWGGNTLNGETNTGGRYNPVTNSWTPTNPVNAATPRDLHTAVWTGDVMIVWGGNDAAGNTNTGGRYDPATDSWQLMSLANAPVARYYHTANWTGAVMVVWGGLQGNFDDPTFLNSGGRYDPVTDTWTPTSLVDAPSPRARHTAVWTGREVIVWGGCVGSTACADGLYTGGRYDPSADDWHATAIFSPISSAPGARSLHTAVWTGQEMIVWGGVSDEGGYAHTGAHYLPNIIALPAMHLAAVDAAFRPSGDAYQIGTRIIVHDESGAGVPGAVVTAEVTTPSGATLFVDLTTNANGVAQAAATTERTGTYTLCVRSVTKSGWLYNFTANEETCTSVTVS